MVPAKGISASVNQTRGRLRCAFLPATMVSVSDEADVVTLRQENEGLRAEIAKLHSLVAQAKSDVPPGSPAVTDEVVVSAPTSVTSSDGIVVEGDIDALSPSSPEPSLSAVAEAAATAAQVSEATAPSDVATRNPFEALLKQAVAAAQDNLKKLEMFASPHIQKIEPFAKTALAKVAEAWAAVAEGAQRLLKQAEPYYQQALLKVTEAMKPLEPTLTRVKLAAGAVSERSVALALTCKEQVSMTAPVRGVAGERERR